MNALPIALLLALAFHQGASDSSTTGSVETNSTVTETTTSSSAGSTSAAGVTSNGSTTEDTTPTTTASSDMTATATQSPQANTTEKTSNSTKNAETTADLSSYTAASSDTTTSTPTAQENTTMETSNSTKPNNTTTANTTAPSDTTTTTTQATLEKNTTEKASNYTEPANITEGLNVSVSVYFFYDFEFEMQAYNRDQGDCKDIKMYLQALLASAELRFQHLKNGSLEFLFAGLNLLKRHELEKIRVMKEESLTVSTLYMFQRFIQQKYRRLQQSTDIFVYISNRTMISEFDGTNASFGYAYQSGICTGSNVAVVRDSAVCYTGSAALAQKIALLLGASWDMNSTTEGCMREDGYLLSTDNGTSKHYNMSKCSQEDMFRNITFKRSTTAKCLNKTGTLPRKYKLPSAMFLSREYCRSYYYTNPNVQDCSKEQQSAAYLSNCQLCCSNTTLLEGPVIGTVAPDGLKCGENKQICIGGECVHDPRLSVTRTSDSGI